MDAGDAHDRLDGDGVPTRRHGPQVPRFGHGSRVPGWDDAVDLAKPPAEIPDPAATPVPDELRELIEGHMVKYPDRRSAVLPALAAAQRHHGWCSPEALEQVASVMRLTPAYLISIASFYDMLETEPAGRHAVYVCTNISCSLLGGDALLEAVREQTEGDADVNVRSFECLGACDIAPMASVDGVYVGPIGLDEVPELVEQLRAGEPPLPAKQLRYRTTADPRANTRDWDVPAHDPAEARPRAHIPIRPAEQGTYGEEMPSEDLGPSAPIEQPPTAPSPDEE